MNKKIGIITFFNALNYGAVLQAYALQKKLKDIGCDVSFIGVTLESFNRKECFRLSDKIKNVFLKLINEPKARKFRRFQNNEFNIIYNGESYEEILKKKMHFDLIVCGSDQIWNPKITNGLQPYYFANGFESDKKISYAASCGNTSTIKSEMCKFKELTSELDKISVREEPAEMYLKEQGIQSQTVVDPTLLISEKAWKELAQKSIVNQEVKEKYIFVYDLEGTEQFSEVVNNLAIKTGLIVVSLRNKSHYYNDKKRFPNASPYDFLQLILNAEYVVSNSYHALMFSYIFNKIMYIVPHTRYSERMSSFLSKFSKTFDGHAYLCVDFSRVSRKNIGKTINDSISFIKSAME